MVALRQVIDTTLCKLCVEHSTVDQLTCVSFITQNVSTNSGEHAHVILVKSYAPNINRRPGWQHTILMAHTKNDAMREITSRVAGTS